MHKTEIQLLNNTDRECSIHNKTYKIPLADIEGIKIVVW